MESEEVTDLVAKDTEIVIPLLIRVFLPLDLGYQVLFNIFYEALPARILIFDA